jgi:diguanylate cyclase (GGDEF)-like protein
MPSSGELALNVVRSGSREVILVRIVLIADDDIVASTLAKGLLESWGFEVMVARDGEEAISILSQPTDAPRIAIVDWSMPGCSGLEVCRRVRLNAERGYTYLIMATARGERKDILEGLSAGADDYLVKPILAAELRARIEIGKRIVNLQEQLLSALASARYEASHDSLTGLWNRGAVIDQFSTLLARCEREGGQIGLLLADIDHFKRLNDTYGHQGGDVVLRHVARLLRCAVRVYDIVGRYGGDEFLIVAPACDLYDVTQLGERMCDIISKSPAELNGAMAKVSISVGALNVLSCSLGHESRLIDAADAVLYQAKNEGRNRMCVQSIKLDKLPAPPPGRPLPENSL